MSTPLARRLRVAGIAVSGLALAVAATAAQQYDTSILEDSRRPAAEKERDAGTKPFELYAFFGVEPGMTVVDVAPGGGYNTFILSGIVGADGQVIAVGDRRGNVAARIESDGLSNVSVMEYDAIDAGSVDMVITVRNVHDFELRDQASTHYEAWMRILRPGGVVGIVDARTPEAGAVDGDTHRINEELIIDHMEAAGFELVEQSDLLRNPDDDYGDSGREMGRYNVDRLTLKFQKAMD